MLAALAAAVVLALQAKGSGAGLPPEQGAPLHQATLAEYAKVIGNLQAVAATCAQKAEACATDAIEDQKVILAGGQSFDSHYEWFSAAMASAKTLPDAPRAAEMREVLQRLNADLTDATTPMSPADFSRERRQANAILAEPEFQQAIQTTLWDRALRWLADRIDRALAGVAALGGRSPWIGPLIEWGAAGLACVVLLLWVLRVMRLQRQSLRLVVEGRLDAVEKRVLNWMREAEQHAERGAFRDAVHCLYWASIAALEGRRLWHPNRSRTPREYLRLLDPSSAAAALLKRQTKSFETIWYGQRPAARADYDQALILHRELRSA